MLPTTPSPAIPYPAIGRLGVIGDRRTAALVAADGTVCWLCLPDYDGDVVFGSLLDHDRGGRWKLGPVVPSQGAQRYDRGTAVLVTTWDLDGGRLELTDAMAWPSGDRPPARQDGRVLLRRLRCTRGQADCVLNVTVGHNFAPTAPASAPGGEWLFQAGPHSVRLWVSRPVEADLLGVRAAITLCRGEEVWAVLESGGHEGVSSAEAARVALEETGRYWERWDDKLPFPGLTSRGQRVRRSALLVHLLSYAPAGSLVAAPTCSLPERIGGDWNADYRYAWVRDASLSLAILAMLGNTDDATHYMDWLNGLSSGTDAPLQIMYGIRGETDLSQCEREDVYGYRGSTPVRFRNHAHKQRQHDALGYLNDCVHVYLENGGEWRDHYWDLVRRAADHIAGDWTRPDNGIWELSAEQHYVSGKVMSWVCLDRAVKIAHRLGHRDDQVERWRRTMDRMHAEVMERGWSDRLGAFRQRYEAENLDAAALLIPVMGFLPPDHPRVLATIDRIAQSLTIDGFVYRFDPGRTDGGLGTDGAPLGEYEGAFLSCTFWLATAYAKAGRPAEAEAILRRAEAMAGPLGLFAEAADPRTGTFLGNTPLLFSQIEYVRAVTETIKARPLGPLMMVTGRAVQRLHAGIRRGLRGRYGLGRQRVGAMRPRQSTLLPRASEPSTERVATPIGEERLVIRPSTRSFLLASGLLAPAAVVLALPLCGLIFQCGCTLTTGLRHCNIGNPAGPHCPWCANPRLFVLAFAASVAGAAAAMGLALRFRRPSFSLATAAGALGFWLTLSAAGLVTAKLIGYPVWYGIRLD